MAKLVDMPPQIGTQRELLLADLAQLLTVEETLARSPTSSALRRTPS